MAVGARRCKYPGMMKFMRRATPLLLLACGGFLAGACASQSVPATALQVGSRIAPATLLDQHEVPRPIDERTRVILFAREMQGGALIRELLDHESASYLEQHHAVYVADISDMPGMITKLVAIPKMQEERLYPTLLDRDGTTTAAFPAQEGLATVMVLDELRVTGIHYHGSLEGLREEVSMVR